MAGDAYQPVWHHDEKQPPLAHFKMGMETETVAAVVDESDGRIIASTAVSSIMGTIKR
jgi:hypothetical protein